MPQTENTAWELAPPKPDLGRPLTPEERSEYGAAWFRFVMRTPAPADDLPYPSAGIRNFVFGEMWNRPGLDLRSRRWITLACVAAVGSQVPIKAHVYAALKSGDVTLEEMLEFALHFAVYCGWPATSFLQRTIKDSWEQVLADGGPEQQSPPQRPA